MSYDEINSFYTEEWKQEKYRNIYIDRSKKNEGECCTFKESKGVFIEYIPKKS